MIINNMFPLSLFQSEFDKLLELPKNLFIDLPVFWTYLAEILKPLVIRRAHPLNELVRTTSVLKNIGLVGKLVGELLKLLAEAKGPALLVFEWNASGIKWTDLIDTSLENPDDIVEQYNLQFLTNDAKENIELAYEQRGP
ncbi:eukaryotic translation initiation factor 4 gamma 1-like [Aphidius gifuensis]|nr:eukaryotic translation initiation factor 4 gamma 1-like [Aphidius gifuensis]